MMDIRDPARYLARRVRVTRGIEGRATPEELIAAAEARGGEVVELPELQDEGGFASGPPPVIGLRPGARPEAIAHELGHLVFWDQAEHGIDYTDEELGGSEEDACNRFAAELVPEDETPGWLPWWAPPGAPLRMERSRSGHGWRYVFRFPRRRLTRRRTVVLRSPYGPLGRPKRSRE